MWTHLYFKDTPFRRNAVKNTANIAALLVMVGFAMFILFLLGHTASDDKVWTRYVYLFGGVEAVAFAAAGFLFGREVHRGQAEAAQEQADAQQNRANASETAAAEAKANGKALAAAVGAVVNGVKGKGQTYVALGAEGATTATQVDLDGLLAMANRLFP